MKKKSRDERAAEKYESRVGGRSNTFVTFLAGVRYARRADIAAVKQEWRRPGSFLTSLGRVEAIEAIRKRAKS